MIHEIELVWIQALQKIFRGSFFDSFFLLWNYVDSLPFSIALIVFFWFFVDRRVGIRLFYLFVLSSILNHILKNYFQSPRPCQIDPSIGSLTFSSWGFPSGAAQTAAIVAGVVWIEFKERTIQYLGIIFALLLCLSRVYLGAHFFSDILGGLCVGGFLLIPYVYFFPWIEKNQKFRLSVFSLLLVLLLGPYFPAQTETALGVAFGLLLEKDECSVKTHWPRRLLWAICGLAAYFLCFKGASLYPSWRFLFFLTAGASLSVCSLGARSLLKRAFMSR